MRPETHLQEFGDVVGIFDGRHLFPRHGEQNGRKRLSVFVEEGEEQHFRAGTQLEKE